MCDNIFKLDREFLYMDDNPPSHVSKLTHKFFEHKLFTEEKIMEMTTI